MPNQPQATSARMSAGIFAPNVPEEARIRTGKEFRTLPRGEHSMSRDEHDYIAEKNREDGLPPIHSLLDQATRQHVSGDADRHSHPERRDAGTGARSALISALEAGPAENESVVATEVRVIRVGHPASARARESSASFSGRDEDGQSISSIVPRQLSPPQLQWKRRSSFFVRRSAGSSR